MSWGPVQTHSSGAMIGSLLRSVRLIFPGRAQHAQHSMTHQLFGLRPPVARPPGFASTCALPDSVATTAIPQHALQEPADQECQGNPAHSVESLIPSLTSASDPQLQIHHADSDGASRGSITEGGDGTAPTVTHISEHLIQDFALVHDQRVRFTPGLNVITGESGSGKSVLVMAFAAILGSPAWDGNVRPPATTAVIEGTFQLSASARVRPQTHQYNRIALDCQSGNDL